MSESLREGFGGWLKRAITQTPNYEDQAVALHRARPIEVAPSGASPSSTGQDIGRTDAASTMPGDTSTTINNPVGTGEGADADDFVDRAEAADASAGARMDSDWDGVADVADTNPYGSGGLGGDGEGGEEGGSD